MPPRRVAMRHPETADEVTAHRVLMLAYHFPPLGGGGVQRNTAFARELPRLGYKLLVVTGSGAAPGRWTPADPGLLDEIGDSIEVRRVPEPRTPAKTSWRRRLDAVLMLRTDFERDWTREVMALRPELEERVDLIYASLVPYELAETAARLAAALEKPWVADLQDAWALDEMWLYPTGLHRRRDLARMTRVLRSAAAIVMNTPEAASRLRAWLPELADKQVVVIPNGFDPACFESPTPPRDDGGKKFRIVHAGYLHTELGAQIRRTARLRRMLGGMAIPIDILTRSHLYLIEALDRLRLEDSALHSQIEVHLAGVLSETDRAVARRSPSITLHGYLSHRDSIALVRSADLLFLPMHKLAAGTRAGLVPGKTYEYLASGRPILAAVPEGDARDLLAQAPNTFLTSPDDVFAMAAIIEERVRAWASGRGPAPRDDALIAEFQHAELTNSLAALFRQVIRRDAGRARSVDLSGRLAERTTSTL
jgi:glycosyltransferase involved in cell wall biosynthesis